MIASLFVGPVAKAVTAALGVAPAAGVILVAGHPRLGAALDDTGRQVIVVEDAMRSLRRLHRPRVCGHFTALPFADGQLSAVVAAGVIGRADWRVVLAELSRVTRPGGTVILIDRGPAHTLSRRTLCGGLVEIEQRQAGRTTITSGLVAKLAAPRASWAAQGASAGRASS